VPDAGHPAVDALRKLLEQEVLLFVPGIVFQEVLTGIRHESQFESLLRRMQNFTVVRATLDEHVEAARAANTCAKMGVRVSVADALIASQTIATGGSLFTTDQDFALIARFTPLRLFDFTAYLQA
jgi:predicted nucleic acid-binding protein